MTEGVDDGWAALQAGQWARARQLFEAAVAGDSSPETYEGLSWAAWWMDDAGAVFAARERAFRSYRDAGDEVSAARVATWLGADELDFNGAVGTASGWLERAQRLLEPHEPGIEHGWLAFHRGYVASLRGRTLEAQELGDRAAEIGREVRSADLEMLGLALAGMSLAARGMVDEGMRCLDEAAAISLAGEAAIPISGAWTCCFMVSVCTRLLDFERAFEWCERIEAFADRYGSRYMLGFCRAEYATIHLWRGRWTQAEECLQESLASFRASRPGMVGGPLVGLAELRRRQGRTDDARALLEQVGSSDAAQLCRARIALEQGDARLAVELCERVRRNVAADRPVYLAPALELMVRAHVVAGARDEAAVVLERLREVAGMIGSAGISAKLRCAEGIVAAARGELEEARPRLEDAVDGFARCGAPFESACARVELASVLAALARDEDARREAHAAYQQLTELGAPLHASRAKAVLGKRDRPAVTDRVSRRESEVLALLAQGLTNREIAGQLFISEHTVHRHVTSILRKLEVPSRTAAVALALREGLVSGE